MAADDTTISRLINQGRIPEARQMLEAGDPTAAERAFFEARVLKAEGRFGDATTRFRDVLQLDPRYVNARRELAHTLLLDKQYDAAAFHFEHLLRSDPNDVMRKQYRTFLRIIAENKPVGIHLNVALLPSTNVNRGASGRTVETSLGRFTINPESQEDSGVGARLGVSGYFREVPDPQSRVTLSWGIQGTRYLSGEYDSALGYLAYAYEAVSDTGRWSIAPYVRGEWRENDNDSVAPGLTGQVTQTITLRDELILASRYERRVYPNRAELDGHYGSGSLGWRHAFGPDVSVRGTFEYDQSEAARDYLSYRGVRLRGVAHKLWPGGFFTSVGVEAGYRDFQAPIPLIAKRRFDEFIGVDFSVLNSEIDIFGFTPKLTCRVVFNQSNIDLYSYDAKECQLAASVEF